MSLRSKIALVTGAGQGIGRATAQRLARAGVNLVIQDIDEAALAETARHLKTFEVDVLSLTGDLTEPDLPEQVIKDCVDAFGGLDIIINNAGYIWNGAMHNHSEAQWQAMLDIHATVPFR
ncbi:MAG TPA: 3-oxoacyl-ACP reductase, partial [Gammaproteobacteria bacterium]|nr:3-oxoacyl-ACP reductase [Gammaproteobacteria bacterium]